MIDTDAALINELDALLPQTQCGQCGHGGCRPYATAMVYKGEAINRCPPGGEITLQALATKLNRPLQALQNPSISLSPKAAVIIDETACIGCTLCIKACPVDAIVGAAKLMHTVITDECTGCELCIAPCPMDCISLIPYPHQTQTWSLGDDNATARANHARQRYESRNKRLSQKKLTNQSPQKLEPIDIAAVVARTNTRKNKVTNPHEHPKTL